MLDEYIDGDIGEEEQKGGSPYVRYIVGLIAFILGLLLLLSFLLWRENQRDADSFAEITEYHLLSELTLEKMLLEIHRLEDAMLPSQGAVSFVSSAGLSQAFSSRVETTLFAVMQQMAILRNAQDRFRDDAFESALRRLEACVTRLSATVERVSLSGETSAAPFVLPVESISFRVQQLDRLHSYAYGQKLQISTRARATARKSFVLIAGAVVLAILAVSVLTIQRISRLSKAQQQAESELKLALNDAQKANEAKTDFLAHMSHDLRTPLNSILGFSQMMRGHTFGPLGDTHYEEYAQLIHHSGERLVNMVNDLLDYARIESGEYVLEETAIDMSAQAKSTIQRCTAKPFKEVGCRFTVVIDDDAPALLSDERALSQILDNLLSNALKYAGEDATFSIVWQAELGGHGLLQVKDTGRGIPKLQLEKVMEPFVQGGTAKAENAHIAKSSEGVGLGLHIVGKLSSIIGAEFKLDSEEGVGTTASLVFPADKLAAMQRPDAVELESQEAPFPAAANG